MQAIHPATTVFTCPYCEHKNELAEVQEGETITCANPACQRQFQVELPKVAPDPELLVPGLTEPPAPVIPVAQLAPPEPTPPPVVTEAPTTGTSVPASETPDVVAVHRQPMILRHPLRFLINVGLVLIGIAGIVWAFELESLWLAGFSCVPIVYGLGRQLTWWLRAKNSCLTITSRGVVVSDGVFTVSSREVYHETIHGIHIFQPWWCRITNSGALMITCGDKDEEIYLDSVKDPHKVAEEIRQQAKK